MHKYIRIIDFGSQYTQLIARRIRSLNVYCEIVPYTKATEKLDNTIQAIVLSGGPASVLDANAPSIPLTFLENYPVLAICYGAQWIAHQLGGKVLQAQKREYGKALLHKTQSHPLWKNIDFPTIVWMSHADSIIELPENAYVIANTDDIPIAAFAFKDRPWIGVQFHPEVSHSEQGLKILENFLDFAQCDRDWTPEHFIETTITAIRSQVKANEQAICALSGGVDSTVAATLVQKAIGNRLKTVFINTGLLRKQEVESVLKHYHEIGLNPHVIDASEQFFSILKGITDPEEKRKRIGKLFIDLFHHYAKMLPNVHYLVQGTIYPDVIESTSVAGPSATIKSHHNVGGLPEKLPFELIEPLRMLFKDEVREVGKALGIPKHLLMRHPFPGPGLAIRIIGEVTPARVQLLQEADAIFIQTLRETGWYDKVWQAFAVLLPVKSVGVMGDQRTYEHVIALRAVYSQDGMTADWAKLPYELLERVANKIINQVKGINRVVYDISTKPPATIEWE